MQPAPRPAGPASIARFTRSLPGVIGLGFLTFMFLSCVLTLPWTMGSTTVSDPSPEGSRLTRPGPPRYAQQDPDASQLPPTWWPIRSDPAESWLPADRDLAERVRAAATRRALDRLARQRGVSVDELATQAVTLSPEQIRAARPFFVMGTDLLGRDLFKRVLAGGGISLTIGLAAALLSVFLGTMYGAIAGYVGGRLDAVMMRIVDILYGLPYVLLVVLLAVAGDAVMDEYVTRARARAHHVAHATRAAIGAAAAPPSRAEIEQWLAVHPTERAEFETAALSALPPRVVSESERTAYDLLVLLVAIGGVSWLTMARVIRGQVLSLRAQPFMEAARALGVPVRRQFLRHLLPNLLGPIIVYATLTVPQAILQESFLSFLGIGVRPPLPSWGNLAADGLPELNPYQSRWWLLVFPCLLLGLTLLALNFVGEGLREAMDPKRRQR
ncbi:MAG: ABC transporter permease [Phycisphaerales bacterium]